MEGEGEGTAGASCRLCGGVEGKLLHLHDTFSTLGTTSSILHLLHSIAVFLQVQSECEALMPHYLCWQCFNTAVDINAFIDSGISYQRSLVGELRPSQHDGAEVAPCDTVLPESVGSSQEEVLTEELVEEREIVLQAVGDQMQQVTGQTETAAVEENVHSKSQESQEDTDCSPEAREQHEDSTQEAEQGGTQEAAQDSTQAAAQDSTQVAQGGTQAAQDSTQVAQGGTQAAQGGTQAAQGGTQAAQGGTQAAAQDSTQDSTQETEAPAPGSEREKCSYCSKTFRRPSQLKSHLARHSGARPHLCVVCGVAFKHRRNLVEHTHTHSQDPAFICAKCGLTFKQKSNLLKHERTHQVGGEYRCGECGGRYSQSSHLKTHITTVHADSPGFRCERCGVVVARRSSLRRHMASVHASVSRFTCPHCSKGFTNQQNYQGHVRSHTGERPYVCPMCPKAFTTPKALSRHRRHHTTARTHKCGECGKAFLEQCDLKRHTKRHIHKSAKRAKAAAQEAGTDGGTEPAVPAINLMLLTDSLLFTEPQALLDNPEPRPEQVMVPGGGKVEDGQAVTPGAVLEAARPPLHLHKKPPLQVPLLPPPPDMGAALQPTATLEVEDTAPTPPQVPRECPAPPDTPTMVVLASASTPAEFLAEPQPRASSPVAVGDVGERVLSHATW